MRHLIAIALFLSFAGQSHAAAVVATIQPATVQPAGPLNLSAVPANTEIFFDVFASVTIPPGSNDVGLLGFALKASETSGVGAFANFGTATVDADFDTVVQSDPASNVIAAFIASTATTAQQSLGVGTPAPLYTFSVHTGSPAQPTNVTLQLEPADNSAGQPFGFLTLVSSVYGPRTFANSDSASLPQISFTVVPEPGAWQYMTLLAVVAFLRRRYRLLSLCGQTDH